MCTCNGSGPRSNGTLSTQRSSSRSAAWDTRRDPADSGMERSAVNPGAVGTQSAPTPAEADSAVAAAQVRSVPSRPTAPPEQLPPSEQLTQPEQLTPPDQLPPPQQSGQSQAPGHSKPPSSA